jgi:hypothetical protein
MQALVQWVDWQHVIGLYAYGYIVRNSVCNIVKIFDYCFLVVFDGRQSAGGGWYTSLLVTTPIS